MRHNNRGHIVDSECQTVHKMRDFDSPIHQQRDNPYSYRGSLQNVWVERNAHDLSLEPCAIMAIQQKSRCKMPWRKLHAGGPKGDVVTHLTVTCLFEALSWGW